MQKNWIRRLWLIPPVAVALAMLFVLPKMKRPPQKAKAVEYATKVRSIKAPRIPLVARAVGYGKTEVALRAIFKAVMDNKQAVVLVPTTILAEQHYCNFSNRLKRT